MTTITLASPRGRITLEQRRTLARSLTDAVLKVEVGQHSPATRAGFQVWFNEFDPSEIAIGGMLLCDQPVPPDIILIDVVVMDGHWQADDRARVIANIYRELVVALGKDTAPPGWWIEFRTIDEGSWGSRGGVLSILDLLGSGVFTEERLKAIQQSVTVKPNADGN